jgi:hypothetical protein
MILVPACGEAFMIRSNGRRRVGLFFGAAALLLFACSSDSGAPFPWDSIDEGEQTEAEVVRLLGRPAAKLSAPFAEGEVLVYPVIRSGWAGYSHAPVLRIDFDSAGMVQDVGFFQPQTGERLPVREKLERARKRLSCGRSIVDGTHSGVRPEVAVDKIRAGQSTREDVVKILAAFEPPPPMQAVPFPRKGIARSREIWEYYVDRPSPLFIPSELRAVVVLYTDGVSYKSFERGYSGCVT